MARPIGRKRLMIAALGLLLGVGCGEDPAAPEPAAGGGGAGGSHGGGGVVPVGPGAVLPCPGGEIQLDDGSCLPPGMTSDDCSSGFEHDGDRSCLPVLPAAPCDPGLMAVPGDTSCRPITDCAPGKWGTVAADGSTQYVDGSYQGTSTGSEPQPWKTVQAGVDAASSGAIVAIAAGSYAESVYAFQPVILWGACPDDVTIDSPNDTAAVRVGPAAGPSTIRDLALTGVGVGIWSQGATEVLVERAWIHDTSDMGLYAAVGSGGSTVTVRDSLFEDCTGMAVESDGATLSFEHSVARGGQHFLEGWGQGLGGYRLDGVPAELVLSGSLVEDTPGQGVTVRGSFLVVEDSVVRNTKPYQDQSQGIGVLGIADDLDPASVTVRGSLIEAVRMCGVCGDDSDIDVERTVVRDVGSQITDGQMGLGIRVFGVDPWFVDRPVGRIDRTVVERARDRAVFISGAEAALYALVVRDIEANQADGQRGRGISVGYSLDAGEQRSLVSIEGCRVERTYESGILIAGSDATIDSCGVFDIESRAVDGAAGAGIVLVPELWVPGLEERTIATVRRSVVERARSAGIAVGVSDAELFDVIVRDTLPQESGGDFGDGLAVTSTMVIVAGWHPARLDVTRATVEQSARAGLATFAAPVSLSDSLFDCNVIDLDGEQEEGSPEYFLENLGGNECRCDDQVHDCTVLSSGLEPPFGY